MFTKLLSTPKTLVRFGVAAARFTAAGRRLRTTGRAATTNGRIWFCTIGAPGTASAVSAWLAPLSAFAAGSRFLAAGPSCCANACTLASVAVVWLSVLGRSATARLTFWSSEANAPNTCSLESISCTICGCLAASATFRRLSELTSWRRSAPRWATAPLSRARSRWVGSNRSITCASSSPPLF